MAFAKGKGRGAKYDHRHVKARETAKQAVSPLTPCARCGHPLGPEHRTTPTGRKIGRWHYDHDEHGGYLGFSHGDPCPLCGGKRCNQSAGSSKGARISNAKRKVGALSPPPFVRRRR